MDIDWTALQQMERTCERCLDEGRAEPKEGCLGDCPHCGKFLAHGEEHAEDCSLEEDYNTMMAAFNNTEGMDDIFVEDDQRIRLREELRERASRMRLFAAREMKQIKGLSELFQGPVIDGGRRAWDWNNNSRMAAEQRWYGGLWDVTDFSQPLPDSLVVGGRWPHKE